MLSSVPEECSKRWPRLGDRLVHKFRQRPGEVVAVVLSVDREKGKVAVQIEDEVYSSLSAAAKSVAGYEANGWVYWGLKTQGFRLRRNNPSG